MQKELESEPFKGSESVHIRLGISGRAHSLEWLREEAW